MASHADDARLALSSNLIDMAQYVPPGAIQAEITTSITAEPARARAKSDSFVRTKSKRWAFLPRSLSKRLSPESSKRDRRTAHPPFRDVFTSPSDFNTYTNSEHSTDFPRERAISSPYESRTQNKQPNTTPQPDKSLPKTPVLDVAIPDVTLERYSVMFSDVLQGEDTSQSTSALLSRRQGSLSMLNTIDEGEAEKPKQEQLQTRPSSHQTKNYFAAAASRSRGATLSDLLSNATSDYTFEPLRKGKRNISEGSTSTTETRHSYTNNEHRQPLVSKFHRPTQSPDSIWGERSPSPLANRLCDPPTPADTDDEETDLEGSMGPDETIKDREESFASQPTGLFPARTTSIRLARPSLIVTGKRKTPQTQEPTSEGPKKQQDIYEVAIARQVSISRQQRKMLGPLLSSKADPPARQVEEAAKTTAGATTVISETKSSFPKVVHPNPELFGPERFRRSELVLLEGS